MMMVKFVMMIIVMIFKIITIKVPEAAFRWIFNHSALDGSYGDSVILGASRVEQALKTLFHILTFPQYIFGHLSKSLNSKSQKSKGRVIQND